LAVHLNSPLGLLANYDLLASQNHAAPAAAA
jgi:hypothetical protein